MGFDRQPEPADNQVGTVGEFITSVLALSNADKEVFYRGHSNKARYLLAPSVYRKDPDGGLARFLSRLIWRACGERERVR